MILLFVFPLMGAVAQDQYVVDPNASVRALNGTFNTIIVTDGIDLYLSQSAEPAMAISAANETLKQGIKTDLENGILKIYFDGDKSRKIKLRKLRVYISYTELIKIDATGASDVVVSGTLTADKLEIKMTGASDFDGNVKINALAINLSGASDLNISGTATTVDISNSGASDVNGFNLVTDYCTVNASGASDINITVNKELNANASGASNINYKGNATVKENQARGASNISRKNR